MMIAGPIQKGKGRDKATAVKMPAGLSSENTHYGPKQRKRDGFSVQLSSSAWNKRERVADTLVCGEKWTGVIRILARTGGDRG